jgi:iron complex outermembrane receptor protein
MTKYIALFLLLFSLSAFAQSGDEVITLEEIDVTETREKQTTQVITQEEIAIKRAENLGQIMATVPGVVITGGGERNETNFRLRGFDAARVPVYIDGVSQVTPYRGEVDHGRILTYDIESIEIQKGYSSMLLGANNIGGVVSLTTSKPKRRFEASARYNTEFDTLFQTQKSTYLLSAGTKQESFYTKLTGVVIDQSHFMLSHEFVPVSDYQSNRERSDSSVRDAKVTLIAGWTPLNELDAHITYTSQRADKEAPGDAYAPNPRIWDWPKWNRDSVAFNADYKTESFYTKLLAYYDKFDSRLYNTRPHGIPSDYDDYAVGTRIQGGYNFNDWSNLQLSAMWKTESHESHDNVTNIYSREIKIEEYTYSLGSEFSMNPWKPLTLALGAGYDTLIPQDYWTASRGSEAFESADLLDGFVYQAGLFYDITGDHELHLTFARKAHFPTMTERFSARYDQVIPNPALRPEFAFHYEFGYKGTFNKQALITASVYFSDFRNKILQESFREPITGQVITHSLNKDKWYYYGFEFSTETYVNDELQIGAVFSYNKSSNRFDKTVQDAYYPEYTGNAYAVVTPVKDISIIPRVEYTSERYTNTAASDTNKVGEYTLLHIAAKMENIFNSFSIEASITNITDTDYEIREFFPMAGRVYALTFGYNK